MKREPYAWRVYYDRPGCGTGYCGEFCSQELAATHAETSPDCVWESKWDSHRKAGGQASLLAPPLVGIESRIPVSWHGKDGWHCVVPVYREERE